jgi:hypothetical protein
MEIDTQSVRRGVINRSRATWYCYLMYGFFMYLLTIQGTKISSLSHALRWSGGSSNELAYLKPSIGQLNPLEINPQFQKALAD